MIRILAIIIIIVALFGGVFFVYQKGQERFSPASIDNQPLNDSYTPPIPTTTVEEDYTALEKDLAEIQELENEFNQELSELE